MVSASLILTVCLISSHLSHALSPWLCVLEVSWPSADPGSPHVLRRIHNAGEGLQRTSQGGLAEYG